MGVDASPRYSRFTPTLTLPSKGRDVFRFHSTTNHSSDNPAAFATRAHFSISDLKKAEKLALVPPVGVTPSAANRSRTSGSFSTRSMSAFSFSVTSRAVENPGRKIPRRPLPGREPAGSARRRADDSHLAPGGQ